MADKQPAAPKTDASTTPKPKDASGTTPPATPSPSSTTNTKSGSTGDPRVQPDPHVREG